MQTINHFNCRRLEHIQNTESVKTWKNEHGIGGEFTLQCSHSWSQIIPPHLFETHPEWFALVDGERRCDDNHKIETTNKELIDYIVSDAIQKHESGLVKDTYSLSPTDIYGFSESAESLEFYEHRDDGKHANITALITEFYRDVCEESKRRGSDVKFAGYLYSVYLDPPQRDIEKLPDNFYPVIAPHRNYGFRLYRPEVREDFSKLLSYWSSKTDNLCYYDLPCWFAEHSFIITPAATKIIDCVFDELLLHNVKGAILYGMETWSQAEISNYILARKMNNPFEVATVFRDEWLEENYGAASVAMMRFYDVLESTFEAYYQQHEEAGYHVTDAILRDLYAAHYAELEQLLRYAWKAEITTEQRAKLSQLVDNFGGLGWFLKQKRFLDMAIDLYFMPDENIDTVREMLAESDGDKQKYPQPHPDVWRYL